MTANNDGGFGNYVASQQSNGQGSFAQNDPSNLDPRKYGQNINNLIPGSGSAPTFHYDEATNRKVQDPAPDGGYDIKPSQSKGDLLQQFMIASVNNPDATIELQKTMIQAGILSPKARSFVPGDIQYNDATFYALSGLLDKSFTTGIDYHTILDRAVAKGEGAKNFEYYVRKFGADGSGPADGGLKQIHSSTTTVSTPLDAQGMLRQKFQQFEGRDPSTGELAAFTSALQAAQRANPTVTDGTYDPALGYRGDRQSTTTGGLSAGAADSMAETYATTGANQQDANTHSIHSYANVLEQALKGGG